MAPGLGPAIPASSLKTISIPVEIVAGGSDQNVPVALNAKYFAAEIPGAKLHIFPGNVAHSYQNPDAQRGAHGVSVVILAKAGV